MVNFKCMGKIFKLSIASFLTVSLAVTTVVCCCVGPAVAAHFHQKVMCGHCDNPGSHHKGSNPGGACQYHLTDAEFSHAQVISPSLSAPVFAPISFIDQHINFLPSFPTIYPRGSPPLVVGTTPLYIQFRSLRI